MIHKGNDRFRQFMSTQNGHRRRPCSHDSDFNSHISTLLIQSQHHNNARSSLLHEQLSSVNSYNQIASIRCLGIMKGSLPAQWLSQVQNEGSSIAEDYLPSIKLLRSCCEGATCLRELLRPATVLRRTSYGLALRAEICLGLSSHPVLCVNFFVPGPCGQSQGQEA